MHANVIFSHIDVDHNYIYIYLCVHSNFIADFDSKRYVHNLHRNPSSGFAY